MTPNLLHPRPSSAFASRHPFRASLACAALAALAVPVTLSAADLTWTGTANGNWIQNNNWTGTGGATNFTSGDNVTFDDSGLATNPTISINNGNNPLTVGTMTVSNTSGIYTISAAGSNTLTGTTLTKSGAGTLYFGQTAAITFANTTLSGGMLMIRQATFNGGAISVTGNTTVGNNSNGAGTLAGTSLTGASVLNIEPYGGGAFVLGTTLDTSNFTGTIRSSIAGRVNVIGSSANLEKAKVELSGGATFQTQSTGTTQIGEITADSSSTLGSGFNGAATYEIGGRNTDSSIAGVIQNGGLANNNGATTGVIRLTKVGTGDLLLTGANTYTGPTAVNDGALLVGDGTSGSLVSAVTVNAGAFFGNLASGNVTTAAVTIGDGSGSADATFGAGRNVIGRFVSTAGLTLKSDAAFVFDVNSSALTADSLTFGDAVTLSGVFSLHDLNTGSAAWSVNDSFTVLSGSSVAGTFTNLADGDSISVNGVTYLAAYTGTGLTFTVTDVAAIPEPASLALLLGLGGLAAAALRRRLA